MSTKEKAVEPASETALYANLRIKLYLHKGHVMDRKRHSSSRLMNKLAENKFRGRFNRAKLPYPISVLARMNIRVGRANNSGYWELRCPFHKNGNEKKPSLNLHQVTGHFLCHACGAKGGDILEFFRKTTGKGFVDAVKDLGAWETYDE